MEKITFTCETITPMFLAGADGQTPELRAPSIKGALRFWWRAMRGGDFDKLDDLKKVESEIWGGVNPARRSSISIRVRNLKDILKYRIDGSEIKTGKSSDYFFYTLIEQRQESIDGDLRHRKGIKENFPFTIELKSRFKEHLREAVLAFRFLVYLGGIGTRIRRCGGAFRVCEIDDSKQYLSQWGISFHNRLSKGMLNDVSMSNETLLNNYSNLGKAQFYQSKRYSRSWREAISDISSKMKNLRAGRNPETGEPFRQRELNKKAAFGLPIGVRQEDKQVNFADTERNNRRASQFFISIYATEKNKLWWVVTKFEDEFMPPNQTIVFKNYPWDEPDFSLSNIFEERLNEYKI